MFESADDDAFQLKNDIETQPILNNGGANKNEERLGFPAEHWLDQVTIGADCLIPKRKSFSRTQRGIVNPRIDPRIINLSIMRDVLPVDELSNSKDKEERKPQEVTSEQQVCDNCCESTQKNKLTNMVEDERNDYVTSQFSGQDEIFAETHMLLTPSEQVQFILGEDHKVEKGPSNDIPCLFTEMEHLKQENGDLVWKEVARWIKFEEVVEEGSNRWSKPHVSSLSLHSVFELRSCLTSGVVLFNVAANSMAQITDVILDQLVKEVHFNLDVITIQNLKSALLSAHEHQGEKRKRLVSLRGSQLKRSKSISSNRCPDFDSALDFNDDAKKYKVPYFTKKIPSGAEAANVLIGELPCLQQRIVALIRLQESVYLGRMTEVPIPSRFVFLLLGPLGNYKKYHEIGRSVATLMADEIFHQVAYKAKTREDLLSGVDEFLDQATVLPPCKWDSKIRLQPPKELPPNPQVQRLVSKKSDCGECDDVKDLTPHEVPAELARTGRLFGGLINDIRRKAPFYSSDFKDCLSIQCLASFIFLYFAILTPIVTFGGLLGDATHNYLGTMESILGGTMSGVIYHLFSGQPLTIIGSTGPILVFEKIMFEMCTILGFKYISFRFWVGLWTGLISILLVAFDVSSLITYVTRYTEESFSALISFIFIYEAFKKLIHEGDKQKIWYGWDPDKVTLYGCDCVPPDLSSYSVSINVTLEEMIKNSTESLARAHEVNPEGSLYKMNNSSYLCVFYDRVENVTDVDQIDWINMTKGNCLTKYCGELHGESCAYTPDAIFMSVVLFFATFTISMALKGIKNSKYFPTKVRTIISDFAVTIAIALMVGFDMLMDINTSKLKVPETFRPTRDDRGWVIDPFDTNPWWSALAALAPALLATILIFMDQQITAVIVNRRENKLKKSCGYHLDLLIVAIMLIICSVMGLPWFVAATVLSITHVNSLRMESETSAPGEVPKFYGIREQRVTGILIFFTIGVSIFLTPLLAHIPMPVLYGVFLYMGVSSLQGVQFFDRIKLFFMPPKHQPDFVYLRHVPLKKVYLFTGIQIAGLACLWFIKSTSPISIVFPMMVAALVGIRRLFDYGIFTQHDLKWLDDLMPESTKKKKEDDKKKRNQNAQSQEGEFKRLEDAANKPGTEEKLLEIPKSHVEYRSKTPNSGGDNKPLNGANGREESHICNNSDKTEKVPLVNSESLL